MTASLAVSLALLLVPRTAHGTHRFLPWISAFAWVMVASCEAAALWALWDPDTRPMDYLEEARIDAADPER